MDEHPNAPRYQMHILWEKVVSTVLLLAPLHKKKMEQKLTNVNLKYRASGNGKRKRVLGHTSCS